MADFIETSLTNYGNRLDIFVVNEGKRHLALEQSFHEEREDLQKQLVDLGTAHQKSLTDLYSSVSKLSQNVASIESENRIKFNKSVEDLRQEHANLTSALKQLVETLALQASTANSLSALQIQTHSYMDEFLFRTTGSTLDADKKGESSVDRERQSEQGQHIIPPAEQPRISYVERVFPPYMLEDNQIENEDRFISYLKTLSSHQKKRYNELVQARARYIDQIKEDILGPRGNMDKKKYQMKLRDVQIEPKDLPNPIWLYPFPHVRGSELPPGTPEPAPWSPNFDFNKFEKRKREEESAEARRAIERKRQRRL